MAPSLPLGLKIDLIKWWKHSLDFLVHVTTIAWTSCLRICLLHMSCCTTSQRHLETVQGWLNLRFITWRVVLLTYFQKRDGDGYQKHSRDCGTYGALIMLGEPRCAKEISPASLHLELSIQGKMLDWCLHIFEILTQSSKSRLIRQDIFFSQYPIFVSLCNFFVDIVDICDPWCGFLLL